MIIINNDLYIVTVVFLKKNSTWCLEEKSVCGVRLVRFHFISTPSYPVVDASDFERTIMPRAIAAAERMWTQPDLLDLEKARIRLPYIRCEYNRRGIAAAPAFGTGRASPPGPGSCMKQ